MTWKSKGRQKRLTLEFLPHRLCWISNILIQNLASQNNIWSFSHPKLWMTNTVWDDNVRSCLIVQPGSKLRGRPFEINPGKICQHLTNWTSWSKSDEIWNGANVFFKWRFRCRRRRGCLSSLLSYRLFHGTFQTKVGWIQIFFRRVIRVPGKQTTCESRWAPAFTLLQPETLITIDIHNLAFSHDVTAAILVFQNNKTAAMLVFQTNPVGVDLFSYVNASFCFNKFA